MCRNWLILVLLLTAAGLSSSELYSITSNNGNCSTCLTIEQLQTNLLSGGGNLTLHFMPGTHKITEPFLIHHYTSVVMRADTSNTTLQFSSAGHVEFSAVSELRIEGLIITGNSESLIDFNHVVSIHNASCVFITHCFFSGFEARDPLVFSAVTISRTIYLSINGTQFWDINARPLYTETEIAEVTNSEFTRNSRSVLINSSSLVRNATDGTSNVSFIGTLFESNSKRALEVIKTDIIEISFCNFTNQDGGAIYIHSTKNALIVDSTFTNNTANDGGAIDCISCSLDINRVTLHGNRALLDGGSVRIKMGYAMIRGSAFIMNQAGKFGGAIFSTFSTVFITESVFSHSSAHEDGLTMYATYSTWVVSNTTVVNSTGIATSRGSFSFLLSTLIFNGSLTFSFNNRPIFAFKTCIEFNGPAILSDNQGIWGGAISVVQSELTINTSHGITITNNRATEEGGGVFINGGQLVFTQSPDSEPNYCNITGNTACRGGGLSAAATFISIERSFLNIDSNSASDSGGGLYLQQGSTVNLLKWELETTTTVPKVKLLIRNNWAGLGGGVYVVQDSENACKGGKTAADILLSDFIFTRCFIQVFKYYQDVATFDVNYVNIFLEGNRANISGSDIYGGLLDRCELAPLITEYNASINGLAFIQNTVSFQDKVEASISSGPVQVVLDLCDNLNTSYLNNQTITVRKADNIKLNVTAIDQVGTPVSSRIIGSVITKSLDAGLDMGQNVQVISNKCTVLNYNIHSKDNSAELELYADGPCRNHGKSKLVFNVTFLECTCPTGLEPDIDEEHTTCLCVCSEILLSQIPARILRCEHDGRIRRVGNIWLGTVNGSVIISECPFDYCRTDEFYINLETPSSRDEQCAFSRTGVLCGECLDGLSLAFSTSKCKQCSNIYLLFIIPFALAGIALTVLILYLNLSLSSGGIVGLIFYANILATSKADFHPFNNFLTIFIAWVNLDLGIDVCFSSGMNSQVKVLLQLVFPIWLFTLMFLIIMVSKYSDSFAKLLFNRNPIAALATLFFLSYSKLLRFIFDVLRYRILEHPDGTHKTVWLYNGNVEWFSSGHLPQFLIAIVILIAGILFTLLLLFGQWFPRCSEHRLMKWTKDARYTALMDAFCAPFTPKHRYWVGLLLFALIIQNTIVALIPIPFFPALSCGCIAVGLCVYKLIVKRVYKSWIKDALETLFLLNLAVFAYGTLLNSSYDSGNQIALGNISLAISFCLFVLINACHCYEYVLKRSHWWKQLLAYFDKCKNARKESCKRSAMKNRSEHSRESDHPIALEMAKFDQYREPALDILDPVGIEHYKEDSTDFDQSSEVIPKVQKIPATQTVIERPTDDW